MKRVLLDHFDDLNKDYRLEQRRMSFISETDSLPSVSMVTPDFTTELSSAAG